MKYRKGEFILAPNKKEALKLRGACLNVYLSICAHADDDGGCFPSINTIAEETGYSRDAVKTALKELGTTKSMISIEARKRSNGSITSNYYQILLWDDEGLGDSTHLGGCVHAPTITQPLNSNKNKEKNSEAQNLLISLVDIVNPREKVTEGRIRNLKGRLKDYTADEITSAAIAFSRSQWHKENGQMSIDNLIREPKFGRWHADATAKKIKPAAQQTAEPMKTVAERRAENKQWQKDLDDAAK